MERGSSSDDDDDIKRNEFDDARASRTLQSFRSHAGVQHQKARKGSTVAVVTLRMLTYNLFIRPPMVRSNADDYKVSFGWSMCLDR